MDKENAVKNEQAAAPVTESEIDYKAELEKVQSERDNYKVGLLKAKGKLPQDVIDLDEDKMEDLATRVASKLSPDLKTSLISITAKNELDSKVANLTSNKDEQELIRYHFEFSTAGENIDERLINAQAIANRDRIKRTAEEINLAKPKVNSSMSMGSSSESGMPKPADDFFTPEQLKWLEERAKITGIKLDPTKLKENIKRTGGMPGMFMTGAHTIHQGVNYK